MAWEWLAPSAVVVGAAASFAGAKVGARVNRSSSADATAQRADQARREEWDRRFTAAIDRTASVDRLQRSIAFTILGELAIDDRAPVTDRQMAQRILEAAIAEPVAELGPELDGLDIVVNDGVVQPEGDGL